MTSLRHQFLLLPALAALLPAQQDSLPPAAIDALGQATGLATVDGVLRADGPRFRAHFSPDGFAYVPAFGHRVRTTMPLRLQLLTIGRGATPCITGATTPPVQTGERTVRYQRGEGIAEQFDVTAVGIELSVHCQKPLPGDGDLLVRYRLDTPLALPAAGERTGDGGLAFTATDAGAVTIGAVTGIDAAGKRTAGSVAVTGDVLELRLPDAFVDTATWPLVLDPLVGTQFQAVGSGAAADDGAADVCTTTDGTVDAMFVFRRRYSSGDADILLGRLSAGASFGGVSVLEGTAALPGAPTIGWLQGRSQAIAAWSQQTSPLAPSDIWAAAVRPNGVVTHVVAVAATAVAETEPDLPSENDSGFGTTLIFRNPTGIQLQRLIVDAAGQVIPAAISTLYGDPTARQPAISKSHRANEPRVVTWLAGHGPYHVVVVPCDGFAAMTPAVIVATSNTELNNPDVDGRGNQYVVAWDEVEVSGSARDVRLRGYSWSAGQLVATTAATTITPPGTDEGTPAVAFHGKFLICYTSVFPLSSNSDVRGLEVSPSCTACGSSFVLTGLNQTLGRNLETAPVIASACSALNTSTSRAAWILFAELEDTPPFASTLVAQRHTATGAGGAVVTDGSDCGAGTIGSSGGGFAVANPDFAFTLTGAPPATVPFLLLGFPGGETPCGPCTVTSIAAATFVPPTGGVITSPYPLSCSAHPFLGITLQAQWALFGSPTSPCPAAAGLTFSARLRVTLGL